MKNELVKELTAALMELAVAPLVYNDNRIEITCRDHADAMQRVRNARKAIAKAISTEVGM